MLKKLVPSGGKLFTDLKLTQRRRERKKDKTQSERERGGSSLNPHTLLHELVCLIKKFRKCRLHPSPVLCSLSSAVEE